MTLMKNKIQKYRQQHSEKMADWLEKKVKKFLNYLDEIEDIDYDIHFLNHEIRVHCSYNGQDVAYEHRGYFTEVRFNLSYVSTFYDGVDRNFYYNEDDAPEEFYEYFASLIPFKYEETNGTER